MMKRDIALRLSRIQAEGWRAARGLPPIRRKNFTAARIDSLNPCPTPSERRRWMEGFMSALKTELT